MNSAILSNWDDQVYFYAQRLVSHKLSGTWDIYLQPEACLVRDDDSDLDLPSVVDLRSGQLIIRQDDDKVIYDGRILFSSGVALFINCQLLLLQRNVTARIDPLRWTSPAGRCDREPRLTGFKEFYEEIILWDNRQKKPIFIVMPDSDPYLDYLKGVYFQTLLRKNRAVPAEQWVYLDADIPTHYTPLLKVVRTFFGQGENAEQYEGKFFVFWDNAYNTLELRSLSGIKIDQESAGAIKCFDGEYDRLAKLFTVGEFKHMPENELVSTMVEFRKRLNNA
jgi:hypothetical protein